MRRDDAREEGGRAGSPAKRQILASVEHRSAPMPRGPWVMFQRWHDLLFAHWPVSREALQGKLPADLELDLYDGRAWLGIVPFWMSGVGLRGTPPLRPFPELNVRTYVRRGEHRGVWFFSLDAASKIAVRVARRLEHLPYFDARMESRGARGAVHYRSIRLESPSAELEAAYAPTGEAQASERGSLADFLTSRYCLFAAKPRGGLIRIDIHHEPWPLQPAEAELRRNSMAAAAGIELPREPPLLHFARSLEVLLWAPRGAS